MVDHREAHIDSSGLFGSRVGENVPDFRELQMESSELRGSGVRVSRPPPTCTHRAERITGWLPAFIDVTLAAGRELSRIHREKWLIGELQDRRITSGTQ